MTMYRYEMPGFSKIQRDMRAKFQALPALGTEAGREAARRTARAVIYRTKRIISEELSHYDSGRLAAGWGIYDYAFIHGGGDPENRALSSEEDAWYQEQTRGGVFFISAGTTIHYAPFVFLGFSTDELRVVRFPDGSFRTVQPFAFDGVNAPERGAQEILTNAAELAVINNAVYVEFARAWLRTGAR